MIRNKKQILTLFFILTVALAILLFSYFKKSRTEEKIILDLNPITNINSQENTEKIDQGKNTFNINDYELIGVIYSSNSSKSQAIIKTKKENSKNYIENEIIDEYFRLISIKNESVLIQKLDDQSITKELKLITVEINNDYLNKKIKEQVIDNYDIPSKAKYMEDAFRESFLKDNK